MISLCDRLRPAFDLLGLGAGQAREVHLHGRALAGLAVDLDMPAGLLHETINLAQAQPGPVSQFFGREERLEGVARARRPASRDRYRSRK